jgi:hypothetical protein
LGTGKDLEAISRSHNNISLTTIKRYLRSFRDDPVVKQLVAKRREGKVLTAEDLNRLKPPTQAVPQTPTPTLTPTPTPIATAS